MTIKINLGCGDNKLPGWENHDADVDITQPLPWPENHANFILIEHCVEHVSYHDAVRFFRESYRVLKIGGVLRVVVPSITQILCCDNQSYFDWLKAKGWASTADTRGALESIIWQHGHQQAWTATLMEATLYACGFNSPRKQRHYVSSHPALCNVEGHHKVIGDEFNRIESLIFEGAKSTGDLSKDYDAKFYAMHVGWRDEYRSMARILAEELPEFKSAVDYGCGNGYLIGALRDAGKDVMGFDGSECARKYDASITIADVTKPLNHLPRDLAICTEVAEHIEERHADALVDNLCRGARDTILFSAAEAGRGGHLHVNEQPRQYWYDKFAKRGWVVDQALTARLIARLEQTNKRTWWFAKNCFVLRRRQPDQAQLDLHTPPPVIDFKKIPHDRVKRRVAIVLGGSEQVWDDLVRAQTFCAEHDLAPEYYATNDMIALFDGPCAAVTLHPDKLSIWLTRRTNSGHPATRGVYSHDGGDSRQHPNHLITQRLKDWGGSVGMFGYVVARHVGHDRVILCGVPMTGENHFVRKAKWTAVSAFTKAWHARRDEMLPHCRSMSGGLTEELFGEPTAEWARAEEKELCSATQ